MSLSFIRLETICAPCSFPDDTCFTRRAIFSMAASMVLISSAASSSWSSSSSKGSAEMTWSALFLIVVKMRSRGVTTCTRVMWFSRATKTKSSPMMHTMSSTLNMATLMLRLRIELRITMSPDSVLNSRMSRWESFSSEANVQDSSPTTRLRADR